MKKIFFPLLMAVLAGAATQASANPAAPQKAPDGFEAIEYECSDNEYPDLKVYGKNVELQSDYGNDLVLYVNDAEAAAIFEVETTGDAVFTFYIPNYDKPLGLSINIDGTLAEKLEVKSIGNVGTTDLPYNFPYNYALNAGKHTIEIVADQSAGEGMYAQYRNVTIRDFQVVNTPLISVELLEPGSLGTEILYNDVERLQDVRALKVKGTMDDDDWEKVGMMAHNLYLLDLSEAVTDHMPDEVLLNGVMLYSLSLPEGLETIGKKAVAGSGIKAIAIPSSVKTIGESAFESTMLRSVTMSDDVTEISRYAFNNNTLLKDLYLSNGLKHIEPYTFCNCYRLNNFTPPANLESIEERAFGSCYNINFDIPSTVTYIGGSAFYYTNNNPENIKETLVWPESCVDAIGGNAFGNTGYTKAEVPVGYNTITVIETYYHGECIFPGTPLKALKLKSATVEALGYRSWLVWDDARGDIDLEVPAYLVNAYKLDPYWYNFKSIKGFDTEEVDHWLIRDDLVLGARERMLGTPSITITKSGSLKINGTAGMPVNNLRVEIDPCNEEYAQMFSNADGVDVTGQLSADVRVDRSNHWLYLSLPFDFKVGDIESLDGAQMAIRYYDGANRAENGPNGSWKDYTTDDIVEAGTGFIINVNNSGTWRFNAQDTDNKQNISSIEMFNKALTTYPSDVTTDMGWNLVGNPYQCHYNIHKLNFTAPITVRDFWNNNYVAYSIIDDDYALRPNEAFFVQCPDGVDHIGFPHDGRQLSAEVLSQQGAPAHMAMSAGRHVMDITITDGKLSDRTRVVINDEASTDFEMTCDASKMFANSAEAIELYTIGTNGENYAINERPLLEGIVDLGLICAAEGKYTISLGRGDISHVYLTDNYTGAVTDLTSSDYEFTAEAGNCADRFTLTFEGATSALTGLSADGLKVQTSASGISVNANATVEVFNLAGMRVASAKVNGNSLISLPKGTYIVKAGKNVAKVSVN